MKWNNVKLTPGMLRTKHGTGKKSARAAKKYIERYQNSDQQQINDETIQPTLAAQREAQAREQVKHLFVK